MTPLHRWPHYFSLKSKWLPRYRNRRFQMSCKAFFSGKSPYITLRLGKCLIKVRIYYLLSLNLAFSQLCDFPQIVRLDAIWGQLWEIAPSRYIRCPDFRRETYPQFRLLLFGMSYKFQDSNFTPYKHCNFTGIVRSVVQWAIALTSVHPPPPHSPLVEDLPFLLTLGEFHEIALTPEDFHKIWVYPRRIWVQPEEKVTFLVFV